MIEIVMAGGWLMLPIILCSVAVIAITIERFWTLNAEKIAPRQQLAQVWNQIQSNQMDGERLKELRRSSPLGRILAAGLSTYGLTLTSLSEKSDRTRRQFGAPRRPNPP